VNPTRLFADKGYRALAVSLRGHGRSPTSKPLRKCSVADYVDDVVSVADTLDRRPVVIGHSMGDFVVEKYLESHDAAAGTQFARPPSEGHRRDRSRGNHRCRLREASKRNRFREDVSQGQPDVVNSILPPELIPGVGRPPPTTNRRSPCPTTPPPMA
jgi:Serine aminopeptidase, S33